MQIVWLSFLTLAASLVGTATGFGTSTIMVPVLVLFMPMPLVLLFVGIIHFFGDFWKMLLFRRGFDIRIVAAFVVPGVALSFAGAWLSTHVEQLPLERILGVFLVVYVYFLLFYHEWKLPHTMPTAAAGGALSGLFAGLFGVGGAVRGAFLAAYDLPKSTYVFISGLIAFFIDITRVGGYLAGGTRLPVGLAFALLICVPVSFIGAFIARLLLSRLPQKHFRIFIAFFLAVIGFKLLLFP